MSKEKINFAAIEPYITDYSYDFTEYEDKVHKITKWGKDNKAPQYLFELYNSVPTLKSIITACAQYTIGNGVETSPLISMSTLEFNDFLEDCALSYFLYGGFAIEVRLNRFGNIHSLYNLDFKNIRTNNKQHTELYYTTGLNKTYYSRIKYIQYPKFDSNNMSSTSIYYYSNDKHNVYPTPIYNAAIYACEIEKSIDSYHLNNINNGFVGSVVISFNNGVPDDEQKEEIERNINEKFAGKENAGRILIAYNDDKDHAIEVTQIQTEDFSERYNSLAKRSKEQIYSAFRITPTLIGITTDSNTGFSKEQYNDQYELFYKTVCKPVKQKIINVVKDIIGVEIEIKPFTLELEKISSN